VVDSTFENLRCRFDFQRFAPRDNPLRKAYSSTSGAGLFELDRPVGVVEELLPTVVTLVAEMNVNERIVFWLDRFLDESH